MLARSRSIPPTPTVALDARHVLDGDESERRGDRLGRAGPAARPVVAHNPVRIRALVLQRPAVPGGDRPGQGALDLDSTYARARFWIGMAEEQLGRSDEAIRELKAAIRKGDRPPPTSRRSATSTPPMGTGGRRSASWMISRLDPSRATSRNWISRRCSWVWATRMPPSHC